MKRITWKRAPFLLTGLVLFALTGCGHSLGVKPVESDENPQWAHRFSLLTDVPYGGDSLQVMDIYKHGERTGEPDYFSPGSEPRDTLIWFHGGGWLAGDKANEVPALIPVLELGWNVYNVNYRQGPNTAPQAVDDVMCAYKAIVDQLEQEGQPIDRIVVSGASAGGHLALVVGLLNSNGSHACQAPAPRAIVNWFGITDIERVDGYLENRNPESNYARIWAGDEPAVAEVSDAYSPVNLIGPASPAIVTVHGTSDSVVPYEQAELLHSALTGAHHLVTIEGGNHSGFTDAQYNRAFQEVFEFLEAN